MAAPTADAGPEPRTAFVRGVTGTVVFVAIVELLVRSGIVNTATLPYPLSVLGRSVTLLGDTEFLRAVWATLAAWFVGMLIAGVVGVGLGALVGLSPRLERLLQGPIELLRPMPAVALAPLLLVLFSRGLLSRSLAVAFAAVWPILFNTIYGMRSVDPIATETARSFGEGRSAVLLRVSLPWTAPFAFTGVRVASAIAIIVTVSVEVLLPDGTGLGGFVVATGSGGGDLATIYGAMVIAGILGIVLDVGLRWIERLAFPWREGLAA